MKSLTSIVILLTAAFALLMVPSSAAIENEHYMHIDRMVMTFEKSDAIVDISYDLDPFAKVYVLLLGSRNLEPTFKQILIKFKEVEVIEIGYDHATILLTNVSRQSGDYYLHDSHELGTSVDIFTFRYPDGSTQQLENTRSTQNTFYSET
ncbi:MAG TPA: hypothetical protein C5S50_03755 [Methanosarcinaceae archaeon]|nr:hypothetical protein [Methanosarcinaceae archaeon]